MAGAVIGALRVVLGADTAALEKGLKDAQGKLASFGSLAGKAAIGLGAAVAGAAVAIGAGVKNALDEADKLGKLAQSVGVPVEQLSALKYAADLSGVGLEDLGKAVGRLNRSMLDIAQGGTGPAADAFKQLGVAVQNSDGTLRGSQAVLGDLAEQFSKYRDGAAKSALAQDIFGKSGAALIPLLNQGKSGLQQMADEAERFGLIIDSRTAKSAENFNDNLTKLGKIGQGVALKFTAELAPSLEEFSNKLVFAVSNSDLMKNAAERLATAIKVLTSGGIILGAVFDTVSTTLWRAADVFSEIAKGNFSAALGEIKTGFAEVGATASNALKAIEVTWANATYATLQGKLSLEGVRAAINGVADDTQKMDMAIRNATAARQAQVAADREYNASLAASQVFLEGLRTPAEQYQADLAKLTEWATRFNWTTETLALSQERLADRVGNTWKTAAPSIAGSFAEIASAFGKENSKMAKAAQILGAVQAFIATSVGAAEAFKLGPIAGLAASAAILAKGAVLVAAIKSASVPNFQTGGSFKVGGTGGPDSQRVSFDASPGEMVEIRRPDQLNRPATVNLTLNGDRVSRDAVREMFETLNAGIRDGYRINFA